MRYGIPKVDMPISQLSKWINIICGKIIEILYSQQTILDLSSCIGYSWFDLDASIFGFKLLKKHKFNFKNHT